MNMKVDEDTRIVSNQNRKEYLEMKHKRDTTKRIEKLERIVEDLTREVNALKGQREN
jgi:hypothetical protein